MSSDRKGPLIAMIYVLVIMALFGIIGTRKQIAVSVDGQNFAAVAYSGTVGAFLDKHRVELGEHDQVTPPIDMYLTHGMVIKVERAVPIQIKVDGQEVDFWVVAATVEGALLEADIALAEKDRVEPEMKTALSAGMKIVITRVEEEIQTVEDIIGYKTIYKNDGSLNIGKTRILQAGLDGRIQRTYLITYEDGVKTTTRLIHSRTIAAARNHIIAVGTGGTMTRGGVTFRYTKAIDMVATGYWADPSWSDGYTAIGMVATKGIVAVDPRVIPLRTRLYVEGYGFALAADVGGAIKGYRIDLCFDTSAEAWAVGRRRVRVYVIGK